MVCKSGFKIKKKKEKKYESLACPHPDSNSVEPSLMHINLIKGGYSNRGVSSLVGSGKILQDCSA